MTTSKTSWKQLWLASILAIGGAIASGNCAFAAQFIPDSTSVQQTRAGTLTINANSGLIVPVSEAGGTTLVNPSASNIIIRVPQISGTTVVNPPSNSSGSNGGNITISASQIILIRSVPEPSSTLGVLAFATLNAALLLKRKQKRNASNYPS